MVGKKGFAFSLISIILVVLFGVMVSSFLVDSQFDSDFSFDQKLKTFSSYYELVRDNYLEIALSVSGRAVLNSMVNYTLTEQDFFSVSDLNMYDNSFETDFMFESLKPFNYCNYDNCLANPSEFKFTPFNYNESVTCTNCSNCTASLINNDVVILNSNRVIELGGTCLNIENLRNKIFDCNNHSIDAIDYSVIFKLQNSSDISIRNCHLLSDPGSFAIYLNDSADIYLRSNKFTYLGDEVYLTTPYDLAYKELFITGMLPFANNTQMNKKNYSSTLMLNKTLPFLISALENASRDIMFHSDTFEIVPHYETIELTQDSPWDVNVKMKFGLSYVSEEFNLTNDGIYVETVISILDLDDPLYGVYSGDSKPIIFEEYLALVNRWSFSRFNDTLYDQSFVQSDRGMSFLMRLTNSSLLDVSSKSSRIESFILPTSVWNVDSPLVKFNDTSRTRSFIDHLFFSDTYLDCKHSDPDPQLYLYNLTNASLNNFTNLRVDFNSLVFYLGSDFETDAFSRVCGDNVFT